MPQALLDDEIMIGAESAGLIMTPGEFDDIKQYDENYRYELIHGVVVVSPIPLPEETNPNERLGAALVRYQEEHPQGSVLDASMPQQFVRTSSGRRLADRLIWVGLGHFPNLSEDLAKIAVEFVSGSKRDRRRDYIDKRAEYREAGIAEYWIIDRFKRIMTVIAFGPDGEGEKVIKEGETYESPHLPGFEVPLALLLKAADRCGKKK